MAIRTSILTLARSVIYNSVGTNAVVAMYFCNKSNAPVTFSVYLASSEQAPLMTENHLIYRNINLTPEDTYVMDTEKLILENGDVISANCSDEDAVVSTVVYVEV